MNNNTQTMGQNTQGVIIQKSSVMLGLILYVSFCLSSIIPFLSLTNGSFYMSSMLGFSVAFSDRILLLLIYALFAYLISRLILRLYMLLISFSMYSVLLSQRGFVNAFETSLIIRNILIFGFSVLVLNFIDLYSYFRLMVFGATLLMFFIFFGIFSRKYVDKISAPAIFRLLFRPYMAYMVIDFVFSMMGVLI